ncbi:MAG TPA: DUF805 domain-containing protein [Sphingomonadaceae bacterium]
MQWMFLPYKRYFDFSGRSRRMEYWMFALLWFIIGVIFDIGVFASMPSAEAMQAGVAPAGLGIGAVIFGIFAAASLIPAIAVTVRRLHDTDRSGWWWFIQLIPLIGAIVMLVFMLLDGTPGPNRFGPDPKSRTDAEVFA